MEALGVILARAGSKGLPGKCMRPLLGRPLIDYAFDHSLASRRLTGLVFSTDCDAAKSLAHRRGIRVVDRPEALATDTARVDDAARHAVEAWEGREGRRADVVVLLYGNVPVRPRALLDSAIEKLIATGADSVRSVAAVGKHHPDWLHRLDGDRMRQFRTNSIYRRQDLEALYYHDGAVVAVTRRALFDLALQSPADAQAFLGEDRRAIVLDARDAVDVDELADLYQAEGVLRAQDLKNVASLTPDEHSGSAGGHGLPGAATDSAWRAEALDAGTPTSRAARPTYVIAEAGVNHDGSVARALALVDAAADAGADAVKFQMFRSEDLATASAAAASYQRACAPAGLQQQMLIALELGERAWPVLMTRCRERRLDFLATPFGVSEVERLAGLGVKAIKIASTDLDHAALLEAALTTGLPVILSTGASTVEEIDSAVERFRLAGAADRLTLLHCVSCYPTSLESANLRRIVALRRRYGVRPGYSDHTLSVWTGSWAAALGAEVVEKHLTLDRSATGPDHAMSLDAAQFTEYVARIREAEASLGTGALDMIEAEADVRRAGRRSLVAVRDLPAGAVLTGAEVAMKRPGIGIPAGQREAILNRRLRVPVPADTLLTWDMVE